MLISPKKIQKMSCGTSDTTNPLLYIIICWPIPNSPKPKFKTTVANNTKPTTSPPEF